jgi:hypothetical protein
MMSVKRNRLPSWSLSCAAQLACLDLKVDLDEQEIRASSICFEAAGALQRSNKKHLLTRVALSAEQGTICCHTVPWLNA